MHKSKRNWKSAQSDRSTVTEGDVSVAECDGSTVDIVNVEPHKGRKITVTPA